MEKETFSDIIRRQLSETMFDASGKAIEINGVEATGLEVLCHQVISKAMKDGALGWKILQQVGYVNNTSDPDSALKEYNKRLKAANSSIRQILRKGELTDEQFKLIAEHAAIAKVNLDLASANLQRCDPLEDPETYRVLDNSLRQWHSEYTSVLRILTVTPKDSKTSQATKFDGFMNDFS